jgi:hypothetical protein
MSATPPAALAPDQMDLWAGAYLTGLRAAAGLVRAAQAEAPPAARAALGAAVAAIDAVPAPAAIVALPHTQALEASIRAALAQLGIGFTAEAVLVLKAALR